MERMADLRKNTGDVKLSLKELHRNTNNTEIGIIIFKLKTYPHSFLFPAHKIESLVKLEAQYGPLPQYSPAIDDVLGYLKKVCMSFSLPIIPVYFCSVHVASWVKCPQRHKDEVTSLFHHQS